jgi:hypothetical protein
MVRERGVEPPRVLPHKILSLARLPVPPLPQSGSRIHYTGEGFAVAMRSAGLGFLMGRIYHLTVAAGLLGRPHWIYGWKGAHNVGNSPRH